MGSRTNKHLHHVQEHLTVLAEHPERVLPEPGGSACCYWNRYGSSATTRREDSRSWSA